MNLQLGFFFFGKFQQKLSMVKKNKCGYVHNKFTSALESVQIVVYRIYVPPPTSHRSSSFFFGKQRRRGEEDRGHHNISGCLKLSVKRKVNLKSRISSCPLHGRRLLTGPRAGAGEAMG